MYPDQHIFEKYYDLTENRVDSKLLKKALGRENSIFQRLNHPHIVGYIGCRDVETDFPRLYLEYCNGGDLRNDMAPTPPPTPRPTADDYEDDDIPPPSPIDEGPPDDGSDGLRRWSEAQVWRLIYQLFAALAHLHYGVSISGEQEMCVYETSWDPAIHRDINERNG
jgi:serine/threonine protein kinase